MKINKILIILFFYSSFLLSQNTKYNPITDPEYPSTYKKLKELYINKLDSGLDYQVLVLTKKFIEKINHPAKTNALMYIYSDPLKYIKDNFSTTSFESYDAAVMEWEALTEAKLKEMEENKEFYKTRDLVIKKWGIEVFADVVEEIKKEYPEKFNLLKD